MASASEHRLELTAVDRASPVIGGVKHSVQQLQGAYAALSAAAVGIGMTAFIAQSVATRAALDDLSDTTGDNVTTLDGLRRAYKIAGKDIAELEGPLTKLAKNLNSADDDGKAAGEAIKALGLDIDAVRAMKPGEAFIEISKALFEFEDGAGKVAVAMALMGREGAKQLKVMKDIGEVGGVAGRVTQEQALAAERLEKEWRRLNMAFEDGKQWMVDGIVPGLTAVIERLNEATKAGRFFWQSLVEGAKLGTALLGSLPKWMGLGEMGDWAATSLFGWDERQRSMRGGPDMWALAGLKPGGAAAAAQGSKGQLDFRIPAKGPQGAQADPFGDLMKRIALESSRATTESNFYSEIVTLLETDKKLREAITAEQRVQLLQAAARVTAEKEAHQVAQENAKMREEILRIEGENARKAAETASAYRDQLDPTRALFREWEKIDTLVRMERLSEAEGAELRRLATARLTEAVEKQHVYTKEVEDSRNAWADLGFTMSSSLEDLIVKGGKLSDVLRAAGQDFARIMFRRNIGDPLAKASEGWFKNLFGNANTTTSARLTEAIDLQGFASGGQFSVGGAGGTDSQLVAFRATPGERVTVETPAQQGASGGGDVHVHMNFALGVAQTVRAEFAAMIPQIRNLAVSAVADARRRS